MKASFQIISVIIINLAQVANVTEASSERPDSAKVASLLYAITQPAALNAEQLESLNTAANESSQSITIISLLAEGRLDSQAAMLRIFEQRISDIGSQLAAWIRLEQMFALAPASQEARDILASQCMSAAATAMRTKQSYRNIERMKVPQNAVKAVASIGEFLDTLESLVWKRAEALSPIVVAQFLDNGIVKRP